MPENPNGYGLEPGSFTAMRTQRKPALTGRADCETWTAAPRTQRFVDLTTGSPAPLDTFASVLWDDDSIYVALWAAEPAVTATFTQRDSLLFYENDLEIFIDGGDSYYELEFNALGTIYEAFYVWRDAWLPGGVWDTQQFAVHDPLVHSFGGDFEPGPNTFWTGSHPRGTRWAYLNYDLLGLVVKVAVDGTANDPSMVDRGWSAEIEIPWSSLTHLSNGRSLPARPGDEWGIFLGRFQQLETRSPSRTAVAGWGASAIGVNDTHVPESFTRVTFSGQELSL